jgi:hypothetical protein
VTEVWSGMFCGGRHLLVLGAGSAVFAKRTSIIHHHINQQNITTPLNIFITLISSIVIGCMYIIMIFYVIFEGA